MSALDDFLGTASNTLGIKSIADFYVLKNKLQIQKGLANSTNTINELKAATAALKTQTEYQRAINDASASTASGTIDFKKYLPYALGAAVLFAAYKFVK